MINISYLITCHNETDTLNRLLGQVYDSIQYDDAHEGDEIVILVDSKNEHGDDINDATSKILHNYTGHYNINWITHDLAKNYGSHKNFGIEHCKGDYIFAIDGDELPPDSLLGENLHALLDSNPTVEAYAVPRINDFRGVNNEHAKQWGWKLTESSIYKRPIVNFPDYQLRIFKRDFPRIGFTRRLHEKIEGYTKYVVLPPEESYALYHDKTIETQIETNIRYNTLFTEEENKGHVVFKN
jgi:glycosyltransferase involved in cell wall biosynthesis